MRAAAAEVAAVGQFGEGADGLPVELYRALPAPVLNVLEVEAAQDLGTVSGPVDLLAAAAGEDVAGLRAGLAADAVLDGDQERAKEGPVVLAAEEFFEAAAEGVDQGALLLGRFRLRQGEGGVAVRAHDFFSVDGLAAATSAHVLASPAPTCGADQCGV